MVDPDYTDPLEEPIGYEPPDYYVPPPEEPPAPQDVITPPVYLWGGPPNPGILDDASDGINQTISVLQEGDPLPYVFGKTTVTPKIYTVHSDGEHLYIDYVLSVGECNDIISLIQGGQDIGKPTTNFEYFLGTAGQSASTLMSGVLGSYDALPDVCHFVAKLGPDDSLDFKVVMEGLKLTDPTNSPQTQKYSHNPALALARILVDCGYTVDWDSVSTVQAHCNELVGGSHRWTVNLPVYNRKNISVWISTFAQYAHCFVDIVGGNVTLIPDAPVTSSPAIARTITNADMVGGSARTSLAGTKNVPKQVTVTYREENGTQRTAVSGSGAAGQRSRLSLPGIQTYSEALRFATQTLNLAGADMRHSHTARDTALKDAIGDLHSITYAPHGISKVMRLIGLQETDRGRWKRSYREYDAALYNSDVATPPSVGDTELPDPNNPPSPAPTPSVVEELYQDETATTYSRLKITWTGVSWPYTQAYKVTCDGEQNVLNALVAHDGAVTHTVYTAALKQGVSYSIKLWVQSSTGAQSVTPGEATKVAEGKQLPPGPPTGLFGYEAGALVALSWNAAVEIEGDLRGYQIRRLASGDYSGASADWDHLNVTTIADRVDATTFLTAAQPEGTYVYMVKSIDTAGTFSELYAAVTVVVTVDTGSVSLNELSYGTLTNMHPYTIDAGDGNGGNYVITSTGETWQGKFGDTSPLATWADQVTSSPAERWGGDLATDTRFETTPWDIGSEITGNWYYDTSTITLLGGTQSNQISLGDSSSPIAYTDHSGNSVQAAGQWFKGVVSTTDSPASPGDGLHIKLPINASHTGETITQEGTATIAATSPLDNPKAVTFATAYATAPEVSLTPLGTSPIIVAADSITKTGMDIYIWDTSGAMTSGSVAWSAKGS